MARLGEGMQSFNFFCGFPQRYSDFVHIHLSVYFKYNVPKDRTQILKFKFKKD